MHPSTLQKVSEATMERSSMVSIAAFGPGDPGSNPGWFAASNSNGKLSF